MLDFKLRNVEDGVLFIPLTKRAKEYLNKWKYDGIIPDEYILQSILWPEAKADLYRLGLRYEYDYNAIPVHHRSS